MYSTLAPIYDRIMSHVEYAQWAAYIERIRQRYCRPGPCSVFEIGAGTGVLARLLSQNGNRLIASDLSVDMCRQARDRGVRSLCADGRYLPVRAQFDMALFLYDGINYLQTAGEYARLFDEVHRILSPGGVFLFDITTQTNSMRYFLDFYDFGDYPQAYYVRHSHYDEGDSTQYNDFTIFTRVADHPTHYVKSKEHHVQKVLPPDTIREWVPKQLFAVVGVWEGFTQRAYSKHSERIHFLLQKRRAP